jgi:hypothetical protein
MELPFDSAVLVALERVRARLLGGTVLSRELVEVCLRVWRVLCEGESANSSPDASREDGCCTSTIGAVRFRFAEDVEDGDDMFAHQQI